MVPELPSSRILPVGFLAPPTSSTKLGVSRARNGIPKEQVEAKKGVLHMLHDPEKGTPTEAVGWLHTTVGPSSPMTSGLSGIAWRVIGSIRNRIIAVILHPMHTEWSSVECAVYLYALSIHCAQDHFFPTSLASSDVLEKILSVALLRTESNPPCRID